jgi:hypothetical protein
MHKGLPRLVSIIPGEVDRERRMAAAKGACFFWHWASHEFKMREQ